MNNIERFLQPQNQSFDGYADALKQMKAGHKSSHWIWYIFPQLTQLGHSETAKFYGIDDIEEARAYLAHPILGARLREISAVLLTLPNKDPETVMGWNVDAKKLRSSMTLFEVADGTENSVFAQVIDTYFGGQRDRRTLNLLRNKTE